MSKGADPVDTLSDEQLAEFISQARLAGEGTGIRYSIGLTDSYVTKVYAKDHVLDVSCAVSKARGIGVRVPAIKRIVETEDGYFEVVQERIRGQVLMDAWADLGWCASIRLAFQLRGMVRRMRKLTSPTAGSLGTGICRSFWLEEYYGIPPHASPSVISSVVNFWQNLVSFRKEASKTPEQHRQACAGPTKPEVGGLVFTHHDMAPRNIILEEGTGKLWLIDWDESGWYPRYFEHAGMRNFHVPDSWGWLRELRWNLFTLIATGWYGKESAMLQHARTKAGRFPAARRFNIMSGATPSDRPVND